MTDIIVLLASFAPVAGFLAGFWPAFLARDEEEEK